MPAIPRRAFPLALARAKSKHRKTPRRSTPGSPLRVHKSLVILAVKQRAPLELPVVEDAGDRVLELRASLRYVHRTMGLPLICQPFCQKVLQDESCCYSKLFIGPTTKTYMRTATEGLQARALYLVVGRERFSLADVLELPNPGKSSC